MTMAIMMAETEALDVLQEVMTEPYAGSEIRVARELVTPQEILEAFSAAGLMIVPQRELIGWVVVTSNKTGVDLNWDGYLYTIREEAEQEVDTARFMWGDGFLGRIEGEV